MEALSATKQKEELLFKGKDNNALALKSCVGFEH